MHLCFPSVCRRSWCLGVVPAQFTAGSWANLPSWGCPSVPKSSRPFSQAHWRGRKDFFFCAAGSSELCSTGKTCSWKRARFGSFWVLLVVQGLCGLRGDSCHPSGCLSHHPQCHHCCASPQSSDPSVLLSLTLLSLLLSGKQIPQTPELGASCRAIPAPVVPACIPNPSLRAGKVLGDPPAGVQQCLQKADRTLWKRRKFRLNFKLKLF